MEIKSRKRQKHFGPERAISLRNCRKNFFAAIGLFEHLRRLLGWVGGKKSAILPHAVTVFILLATVLPGQPVVAQDYLVVKKELTKKPVGWLQLQADRPVFRVFVDSLELAHLPAEPLPLPAGEHVLHAVAEPLTSWLLRDAVDTVRVVPGDTTKLVLHFPRYKILDSRPFGARVYLSGRYLGETPLILPDTLIHSGEVRLELTGYRPATVRALTYESGRITIPLIPEPAYWQQVKRQQQALVRKLRRQKRIAALSFGLSLSFGTAAYFLKKEANRSFSQYLKAGTPQEMDRYFTRAIWLDRTAAGAYLTFEAGLLISAYLYFKSLLGE